MRRSGTDIDLSASLWHSPIGWLSVTVGNGKIIEILCHPDPGHIRLRLQENALPESADSSAAMTQMQEYFSRKRREFRLRLDFDLLSPFTAEVLKALASVPFGRTVTYGELAALVGRPGAARAVGRAMATNPFPLVMPCHRVVGAGGKMTGYSGGSGISTKEWLLAFERVEEGRTEDLCAG
jgi:methylated-DNA-[protein]-cysteine S-methyltransferase